MPDRLIIHIDDYMFDLTNYCEKHPGGEKILMKYKDKDATQAFNEIKGYGDAYCLGLLDKYCIGKINK
jgi:cytochrome b involved in lipid metabolism